MALREVSKVIALTLATALSGCGLYTPDKDPFNPSDDPTDVSNITRQGKYESAIVDHVACEIGAGLTEVKKQLPLLAWFREWGTTVTQTITVEDQTGLSPGISQISPLQNGLLSFPAASGGNVVLAQSSSFNLGGTASANSLRTETIQYTFENRKILEYYDDKCLREIHGAMIEGDLKIRQFVYDKAVIASLGNASLVGTGTETWKIPPFNTFTEEITFVASYGASATPTWHLARFSANTSSNLLVTQRTNTNDLIITLGPIKCPQVRGETISLSAMHKQVEAGKVRKVTIKGSEFDGEFSDRTKFLVYAPNDSQYIRSLVAYLNGKGVVVTFGPSNEPSAQACPKEGGPVELADAAMNQHQARVSANAIAVSITSQTH
jgi:hypothetical protein